MLKMKYLMEDFDLARLALTHWPHDEATLPERLTWFRISASAVYPFDDAGGRLCFLRLIPAEETSAAELQGELDFLGYLQRCGYPAMRPIPSSAGETLLTIGTPDGLWYASAFTGVPGQPLEDLPMTDALAGAYGAALGRLHALSMACTPHQKCRSHAGVLAWAEGAFRACGAPPALAEACRDTAQRLSALPRTAANYGMVHYDFEPDNVFWDGTACHAIDFGDAMLHFYAIDLVQALDELDGAYHAAFLRGYRAACPGSEADEADFPLMRRFRDLLSCARLHHCLSDVPDVQPSWMPVLVQRLEQRRDELARRF